MSHPSRVRGLKYNIIKGETSKFNVAPFTGAWIEMSITANQKASRVLVAPFTGAWIEIIQQRYDVVIQTGRTLHGCVD